MIAHPGTEREAAVRLGRIGFDNVAGYLEGRMQALDTRPDLVGGLGAWKLTAAAGAR